MSMKNTIKEVFWRMYLTISGVYFAEDQSKPRLYRAISSIIVTLIPFFALVSINRGETSNFLLIYLPILTLNLASSYIDLNKITKRLRGIVTLSDSYKDISIVGLLAKDKYKNMMNNLQYLFFGGAIFLGLRSTIVDNASNEGVFIMVALGVIVFINYMVFIFRVKAGYYGNNVNEAREIVKFIHENSKDIGGGSGCGGKRILEENSLSEAEAPELTKGLQHV